MAWACGRFGGPEPAQRPGESLVDESEREENAGLEVAVNASKKDRIRPQW